MDAESIDWINAVRRREIEILFRRLPWLGGDLLEIGGGSGQQAALLQERGLRVLSIDVPDSGYRHQRIFEVIQYDGARIPFPDARFDLVFSSNTLEHVAQLDALEAEMQRVLRPGGRAVHIVPSHRWRLWTWLTHYPGALSLIWHRHRLRPRAEARVPRTEYASGGRGHWMSLLRKALIPDRHGERGTVVSEYAYFHPRWWSAHFERAGWRVVETFDMGLFYTGNMVVRRHLSMAARERLGHLIGGATQCYVLELRGPEDRIGAAVRVAR
jgi:SAM-dependent methyltransferase